MLRVENQCCDCATDNYPCIGELCPNRNVPVYYCDECGFEIDGDVYEVDGEELCEDCLKDMFKKVEDQNYETS